MSIEKNAVWIRSPTFKKYFATAFGVQNTESLMVIDFGDEKTLLTDKKEAYVSDCQIKMTLTSFEVLIDLLEKEKKKLIKEGKLPIEKKGSKKKK